MKRLAIFIIILLQQLPTNSIETRTTVKKGFNVNNIENLDQKSLNKTYKDLFKYRTIYKIKIN